VAQGNAFYAALKVTRHRFSTDNIVGLFRAVDERHVDAIAANLSAYMNANLAAAFENRDVLTDYRTNPYVLMTSASVMNLTDPGRFASFLFNTKLYMSLETSFGKSIEAALVGPYPINSDEKWIEAPEKAAEFNALAGLSLEQRARRRTQSVWREIDKSCVLENRRYLVSIKSGPNTINDTQVQAMTQAIIEKHAVWMMQTRASYAEVRELDIVVGLTYGTDRTTNNKENQILVKLLEHGFEEEDRRRKPGVLIDSASRSIRVYRRIGKDFWAFIGNPHDPTQTSHIFLEILLGLAKALSRGAEQLGLEERINVRIRRLSAALAALQFPRASLPEWIRDEFSEDELFWFATAMTAFFDEGI